MRDGWVKSLSDKEINELPPRRHRRSLSIRSLPGLSNAQASARLRADGYNELPSTKPRRFLSIAWQVVSEPMFLLLIAIGAIYVFLGDLLDSMVLLASLVVIIGISLYQEYKTERGLEALHNLSRPLLRLFEFCAYALL